ncbi:MAG: hypothetical protein IJK30_05775 [Ruminococcus sp.]|nr:hypothetical protein [Ruminococcus sp.]
MEEFRKKLRTKIVLCRILAASLLIAMIVLQVLVHRGVLSGETNMGFFVGGITVLIMNIMRMKKAVKDDAALKQWYVRNTDERTIAVQQKAGNFTSLFTIFLLGIAAVAASYINETVYWTLGAALGVYLLVYLGALVYYNKKM